MKFFLFICLFILTFLLGCTQKNVYKYTASDHCSNLELFVGRLFPAETISLYYNGEMILKYKVDSLDGYRFKRKFCLKYVKKSALRIISEYHNKKYIDTILNVETIGSGYIITVSYPLPITWKNYKDTPVSKTGWGYLPINKSKRVISFNPDTILNDTWTDQ